MIQRDERKMICYLYQSRLSCTPFIHIHWYLVIAIRAIRASRGNQHGINSSKLLKRDITLASYSSMLLATSFWKSGAFWLGWLLKVRKVNQISIKHKYQTLTKVNQPPQSISDMSVIPQNTVNQVLCGYSLRIVFEKNWNRG